MSRSLTSAGSRAVVLAGAPGLARPGWRWKRWACVRRAGSWCGGPRRLRLLRRSRSAPSRICCRALAMTAPDRAELLRRSVDGLVAAAGDRRLLVGIDDAHLLDDSSAALVHQLATATPVTVLVTVRSGTQAPDPIVALWKDTAADRFEIQALSRAEVGAAGRCRLSAGRWTAARCKPCGGSPRAIRSTCGS